MQEGFFGANKEIIFSRPKLCYHCSGIGFQNIDICSSCKGYGKLKKFYQDHFNFELLCPTCQGTGKSFKEICAVCKGNKFFDKEEMKLLIKIPAGINDDQSLVIENYGEPSSDGIFGNLIVFINFKKEDIFFKKDLDVFLDLYLPYTTFVMGGLITVPTIDKEEIEINIPAGTQVDTNLKIKNKGYFNLNNKNYRGEMIVKLKISIPKNIQDLNVFEMLKKAGY